MKSSLVAVLMLFIALAATGQVTDSLRYRLGLELYDAIHQGAHVRFTYRPKNAKHFECAANLGFNFWRHYTYLSHVRDIVHGYYGSFGVQWRFRDDGPGAWLYGGFVTFGGFRHQATATIPNYYGDLVQQRRFETGYLGLQLLVARSYEWRRWRLDGGIRISTCQTQLYKIAFHSYQPGIGRANMWMTRQDFVPSLLVYPFLALSFGLK